VDPRAGEKFPRGNYCDRGAASGRTRARRTFHNPFLRQATFIAAFTGGIRAWDIREPQAPVEVGFYVPVSNANTVQPDGYMTNNVESRQSRVSSMPPTATVPGWTSWSCTARRKRIGLGRDKDHDDRDHDGDHGKDRDRYHDATATTTTMTSQS